MTTFIFTCFFCVAYWFIENEKFMQYSISHWRWRDGRNLSLFSSCNTKTRKFMCVWWWEDRMKKSTPHNKDFKWLTKQVIYIHCYGRNELPSLSLSVRMLCHWFQHRSLDCFLFPIVAFFSFIHSIIHLIVWDRVNCHRLTLMIDACLHGHIFKI